MVMGEGMEKEMNPQPVVGVVVSVTEVPAE
jgi:hypothetical protein